MHYLQLLLYNTFIRGYYLAAVVWSLFNDKAKRWVRGRQGIDLPEMTGRVIWVHCASVGEFEQGRPLIEKIKKRDPAAKILLTFFSPSGYDLRKDYELADEVSYLPIDTPGAARRFLDQTSPSLAIFIKYEYWYHYLKALQRRGIPTYVVSAVFRESHVFFQWFGGLYRTMLEKFTHVFVQDRQSATLVARIGIDRVTVTGDTRFDRVAEIRDQAADYPVVAAFKGNSKVLVAGSTWEPDENLLTDFINQKEGLKYVIAPHEIKEHKLAALEKKIEKRVGRYSQVNEEQAQDLDVLIIDNVGMLSSLYRYGEVAYIGGGFGAGIHNTLEAAVYGIPVMFGPRHQKFLEAVTLIERRGAFAVRDRRELFSRLSALKEDDALYRRMAVACRDYVAENLGATERVMERIGL